MASTEASSSSSKRQGADKKQAWFPLSTRESWAQWWSAPTPKAAENRVLSFVPYLQPSADSQNASVLKAPSEIDQTTFPKDKASNNEDPHGPRRWKSERVDLDGTDRWLNEFSIEKVDEQTDNHLVMLHGYGAGLGFFYKNFEPLSRLVGWKLHALDLLGMGCSSRPPFRIHAKTKEAKITEAESWFIDSLEEWRVKKGINRFTLLGHSLGGYMAAAYTLKYPGRVNKLILASPVGIPEDPYAVNDPLPDNPSEGGLATELRQDVDNDSQSRSSTKKTSGPGRPYPKWLTYLWDANVSPFQIVRWSGGFGPRLISGWSSRRFAHLPEDEAKALHEYTFGLFRQKGSSEYALAYILAPGAFARSPLIRRIGGIGRQPLTSSSSSPSKATPNDRLNDMKKPDSSPTKTTFDNNRVETENGIPVVLMYGSHDWMDASAGREAARILNAESRKHRKEGEARENGDAKVVDIQKAGHHLYLDNPEQFNDVITEELRDVEVREKRLGYQS